MLEGIVKRCHNFLFIMTESVFDSNWCMLELKAAVEAKVHIILITKYGARWKDPADPSIQHEFPPPSLLDQKLLDKYGQVCFYVHFIPSFPSNLLVNLY